jgi:single-stranded-DNA-specific exonuclease
LGIAASRLAECHFRPVVLIATPPGEAARGSARSVPGVDIRAALAEHSRLLGSFGGHPMAAGFSISPDRIPELRRALTQTVGEWVGEAPPEPELAIEAYFSLPELSLDLVDELARLAPFGAGNPPLYLATQRLRVTEHRAIGRTGEHRRLELQDEEGHAKQALWWQSVDLSVPEGVFDLAYALRANVFRGERTLQLEWVDARWVEKPAVEIAVPAVVADVADYRALPEPLPALQALWEQGTMQLWAEAVPVPGFPARSRSELEPAPALVVWTTPPGPGPWQEVLRTVQPEQVYLFAVAPELDALDAFLRRLAGLVKHALSAYNGRLEWHALAAAMAHRTETVQTGVRWLMARGQVSLVTEEDDAIIVEGGGASDEEAVRATRRQVQELLRETEAYRAYFQQADARRLVAS